MLNSITNALHAFALLTYTGLVYAQNAEGDSRYTPWILSTFAFVSVAKLLGMIVHLPMIDRHRQRHNFFWILISIVLVGMNFVTLRAIEAPLWALVGGTGATLLLAGAYVRTLFTSTGHFHWIAAAMALVYILCATLTTGALRLAWLCLIGSQILWILLERVPVLARPKLHNDIYHIALIGSSFLLYKTIDTGLWQGAA